MFVTKEKYNRALSDIIHRMDRQLYDELKVKTADFANIHETTFYVGLYIMSHDIRGASESIDIIKTQVHHMLHNNQLMGFKTECSICKKDFFDHEIEKGQDINLCKGCKEFVAKKVRGENVRKVLVDRHVDI